jgi:hypothetical protein
MIPKEIPSGADRANSSTGQANRDALPMKVGDAAIAAERSEKGTYVDR